MQLMSDVKFGSWSVAESPVTVEYSLVVIEEIRHEVAEGFQRLSRGGIEVGGILYGTRDGRTVRVLAMRPIVCEHARGPGFLFSDKDRIALNEQLVTDKEDPQLQDLISVGWFLSHTRSEIALTESDLEIYSIFFPAPWQVTLVIRPGRGGSMRAGFFVREADGTVRGDRSYLEFNFPDRLAGILDRPPADRAPRDRPPRENAERRTPSYYRAEATGAAAAPAPARRESPVLAPSPGLPMDAGPQLLLPQPRKRKWPWLLVWALVLIAAVVFGLRYWMPTPQEPISLAVVERDGELQIEWNHAAKPVARAVRGSLQIMDGSDSRTRRADAPVAGIGQVHLSEKIRRYRSADDGGKRRRRQSAGSLAIPGPSAGCRQRSRASCHRRSGRAPSGARRPRCAVCAVKTQPRRIEIQQLERTLRVLETRLNIDK